MAAALQPDYFKLFKNYGHIQEIFQQETALEWYAGDVPGHDHGITNHEQ